ncbi:hypothetical protein BBJ28_00015465 [Nothophytophthora sp. Chile5]|nr:hypothetical protein BBJ28_00015465 [Nothophytophthora sp. Chile5]
MWGWRWWGLTALEDSSPKPLRDSTGVQRLVLVDSSRITDGDLDGIPFQAHDVGGRRDERLAAILHRLNPDVEVTSLQLSLSRQGAAIVETLRSTLASSTEFGNDRWESAIEDEWSSAFSGKKPLHVVFLCSHDGGEQLAVALNELCCEFALALVVVSVGKDGISGQSVLVAPGESSCLQCLQKRKVWKAPPPNNRNADEFDGQEEEEEALQVAVQATEGEPETGVTQRVQWQQEVVACLPSTDCILSGLIVQNVLM